MTGSSVKSIKGVTFICKIPLVGKYDLSDIVFLFSTQFPIFAESLGGERKQRPALYGLDDHEEWDC